MVRIANRLTYANVMATVALFVALGGSSYAAVTLTGKNIKNESLTGADVKNRSLSAKEFSPGALPAGTRGPQGERGPAGPQGERGPQGATGTVDTSKFYDKAASDGRFLGLDATAADAAKLGNLPATSYGRVIAREVSESANVPNIAANSCFQTGFNAGATGPRDVVMPFAGGSFPSGLVLVGSVGVTNYAGAQLAGFKICNVTDAAIDPGPTTLAVTVLR